MFLNTLKNYKRIDPVLKPPLIIEIDEDFDNQDFQEKLNYFKKNY